MTNKFKLLNIFLIFLLFLINNNLTHSKNIGDLKLIVIDPGHGGKDHGCSGSITKEKDVVLSISKKLGNLIEKNIKDLKFIYTRQKDTFVTLIDRSNIANKSDADLFICIHANANLNPNFYGTETYVMGLHKSEASLEVQKRENLSILEENNYTSIYDFDPNSPESYIIFSMYQNLFLGQSLSFASLVEDEFLNKCLRNSRGVKQAGFLVLFKTSVPSVLIETGFLTNPKEEEFLNSEKGQELIASSIYRAIKRYKTELKNNHIAISEENKKIKIDVKNKDVKTGIYYSIRFAVLSSEKKFEPNYFDKSNQKIFFEVFNNKYYYYYGEAEDNDKAIKLLEIVKNKGFKDAYIVTKYY